MRRSTLQIKRREKPVREGHLRRVQQEARAVDRHELRLVHFLLVAVGRCALGRGAGEAVDALAAAGKVDTADGVERTRLSSWVSRRAAVSTSSPGFVRPFGMLHGARRL